MQDAGENPQIKAPDSDPKLEGIVARVFAEAAEKTAQAVVKADQVREPTLEIDPKALRREHERINRRGRRSGLGILAAIRTAGRTPTDDASPPKADPAGKTEDPLKERVRQETTDFKFDALLNGVSTLHREAVVRTPEPPARTEQPPAKPAEPPVRVVKLPVRIPRQRRVDTRLLRKFAFYLALASTLAVSAYLLARVYLPESRPPRLHDRFVDAERWNLIWNGGTVKAAGQLKLNVDPGAIASPLAESVSRYDIADSRQSIEVISHTGAAGKSAFLFSALTVTPGRSLEIKLDDTARGTLIVCGYYLDGKYRCVAWTRYRPGRHRYLAFHQRYGRIYFECSKNGVIWGQVGSTLNPFGATPLNVRFTLQHKVHTAGAPATGTVVGNFNEIGGSGSG